MADTVRSLAALQALLADNTAGDISAQDARDVLISAYQPHLLMPGGRLTTESGVGVSTSDRTSQSTLYYTPYRHNGVGLYDGTSWKLYLFTEVSLALSGLTSGKNYDVFLYDNSGTLTLELSAAWTNDTTRADALTTQDGVYVKSGTTTRRWLGTIRTTGTTTTEDSGGGTTSQTGGKRFVWNAYNQVLRRLAVIDTTDTWSYATGTWRQENGAAGNKVEYVTGDAITVVQARFAAIVALQNTSGRSAVVGVGVDSVTVPSGLRQSAYNDSASVTTVGPVNAFYSGQPGLGYHYLAAMEYGSAGTCIFNGDGGGTVYQSGLYAEIMG